MADEAPSFAELAAMLARLPSDGKPSAAAVPTWIDRAAAVMPSSIDPDSPPVTFGGGDRPPPSIDQVAQDVLAKALLQGADTRTGAPVLTRAVVGAAPEADRLGTLQRQFPDAMSVPGSSNFVYTDPATGRRQTYAPIGFRLPSVGDIASVGGEIAEGLGGIAGASAALPSGPVGAAAGGGLGAAAGKEGWQRLMSLLGSQDTRTLPERGLDLATTAGLNAVLPEAGSLLGRPIASLLTPGTPTATQQAARELDLSGLTRRLETTLPGGIAAESTRAQKLEQPLFSLPFSGGMRERYGATRTALEDATQAAATRAAGGAPVPAPNAFASNVGSIAQQIEAAYRLSREQADAAATTLIGADRPVDLAPLRALQTQLQTALARAPDSLAERYQPALDQIDRILGDAGQGGTLPYEVMRNIRTDVGKGIDFTATGGAGAPTGLPSQRDVYGALNDSLRSAARDAGPQAEAALAAHDAMVTAYHAPDGPADTFTALMDPARRSDRLTTMMQSTKPIDQNALAHLVHYATPEQRQELSAGTIQQMGTSRDGTFDMPTWFNNYKQTSQPARDLMFGPGNGVGSLQHDLNNLATVQRTMGESAKNVNFSNSAPVYATMAALGMLGETAGHLFSGEIGSAVTGVAGMASPIVAGRLMSSQPFIRWLTGTWGVNGADAAQWTRQLARLGTVAEADPRVAGLVAQLRQQLPDKLPAPPPRQ